MLQRIRFPRGAFSSRAITRHPDVISRHACIGSTEHHTHVCCESHDDQFLRIHPIEQMLQRRGMKSRMLGLQYHQISFGRCQGPCYHSATPRQPAAFGQDIGELAVPSPIVVVGINGRDATSAQPCLEAGNCQRCLRSIPYQACSIGKLQGIDDIHQQKNLCGTRHSGRFQRSLKRHVGR
ncbi:hypothetical protein DJFAAGMI_04413 [Comamonas sp. PE63]|uniref:Uncharacterized protein n=1 Tax=Comamonas brasiliensis TaxID=1812482 RepID=A0ABS5LZ98_9BURK|nr:hypothetical protein [Comamonas sp. PE63]